MTHPSSGILAIKIQLLTKTVNKIVWSSVNKSLPQTPKKQTIKQKKNGLKI